MSVSTEPRGVAVVAALVCLVGLVAYLPGLSGPLLFDDRPALTANELVQISGESIDQWRAAALSSNSGHLRRPVAMLSFAANHAIAGEFSSLQLKATNLAIHLCIGVVLYAFFLAVVKAMKLAPSPAVCRLLALTGAAIWFLHPLNVSTVLYAVQRMAQLSTFFVVCGLLVYMTYRQRWSQRGAPAGEIIAAGLWLLLLTALATLSKENGVLLPWLLLVLEVCIFRGRWAGRDVPPLRAAGWVLLVLPLALALAMLSFIPDLFATGYARRDFTLDERLMTQARLLWRYLGWIIVPNILDMGFQHDDIPISSSLLAPVSTLISLLGWLAALGLAILLRSKYPLLLLCLLFFLVGHSIESSVIPLEMVYEHRNYLPSMMVCLAVASIIVIPVTRTSQVNAWYPILGVLVFLSLLLFMRAQTWSDELTLAETNAMRHPGSSRSNYFYADALLQRYRHGEALGLSYEEQADALLLSRHFFERMHDTNPRDLASLVMLFYLDSYYFPDLKQQVDWLLPIEELVLHKKLQATDWNALELLFTLAGSDAELLEESRVRELLDSLTARYPRSVKVKRYRYQYLSAVGADIDQLRPILHEARERSPGQGWMYRALMVQEARAQDKAGIYEAARLWLQHDRLRLNLQVMKPLFAVPPAETGVVGD